MANIYRCRQCGGMAKAPHCEDCGSVNVEALGDLYLGALGLDAYVGLLGDNLIVKKPSGQVVSELQEADRLPVLAGPGE